MLFLYLLRIFDFNSETFLMSFYKLQNEHHLKFENSLDEEAHRSVSNGYSVSAVVKKTGITPRRLYYWESLGLVSPIHQQCGERQFRRYSQEDVTAVLEVKTWLEVGYSLEGVRRMKRMKSMINT